MAVLPLFAYGTLRDEEFTQELFGRTFSLQRAVVTGYAVVSGGEGYLAAIPLAGGSISGMIVGFDAAAYLIADAWEDLSVYRRVTVSAQTQAAETQTCFMYIRSGLAGTTIADERPAELPRAAVIADIRRFRQSLERATPERRP